MEILFYPGKIPFCAAGAENLFFRDLAATGVTTIIVSVPWRMAEFAPAKFNLKYFTSLCSRTLECGLDFIAVPDFSVLPPYPEWNDSNRIAKGALRFVDRLLAEFPRVGRFRKMNFPFSDGADSLEKWRSSLEAEWESIESLNLAWGRSYFSFDSIPPETPDCYANAPETDSFLNFQECRNESLGSLLASKIPEIIPDPFDWMNFNPEQIRFDSLTPDISLLKKNESILKTWKSDPPPVAVYEEKNVISAFRNSGIPFSIFNEKTFPEKPLYLILPEVPAISVALSRRIQNAVHAGGAKLLCHARAGNRTESGIPLHGSCYFISEILGVTVFPERPLSAGRILKYEKYSEPIAAGAPVSPISLIRKYTRPLFAYDSESACLLSVPYGAGSITVAGMECFSSGFLAHFVGCSPPARCGIAGKQRVWIVFRENARKETVPFSSVKTVLRDLVTGKLFKVRNGKLTLPPSRLFILEEVKA